MFYDEYENIIVFDFKEYKILEKEYEKNMNEKYEYIFRKPYAFYKISVKKRVDVEK